MLLDHQFYCANHAMAALDNQQSAPVCVAKVNMVKKKKFDITILFIESNHQGDPLSFHENSTGARKPVTSMTYTLLIGSQKYENFLRTGHVMH